MQFKFVGIDLNSKRRIYLVFNTSIKMLFTIDKFTSESRNVKMMLVIDKLYLFYLQMNANLNDLNNCEFD